MLLQLLYVITKVIFYLVSYKENIIDFLSFVSDLEVYLPILIDGELILFHAKILFHLNQVGSRPKK